MRKGTLFTSVRFLRVAFAVEGVRPQQRDLIVKAATLGWEALRRLFYLVRDLWWGQTGKAPT